MATAKASATTTSNPTSLPELRGFRRQESDQDTGQKTTSDTSLFSSVGQDDKGKKQGLLLGKYEVGRKLGQGSFAKVYLARSIAGGEFVAIKALEKRMIAKKNIAQHIKREIVALHSLRHPNIVHLHEVMATKTMIYIVMEYVRGGDLFARIPPRRGLPEDKARKYFQQLISTVAFCHARGVFHRDLKPENILVDENHNIKVSDFGLSAVSESTRRGNEQLNTFLGTPAYVAPEVLGRTGYDGAKVDVWSCGVILFVLVAGYLPFDARNIIVVYKKIYRGIFQCPARFSQELVSLLRRILVTDPKARITMPEIMEDPWFKPGFKHERYYFEDGKYRHMINSDYSSSDVPQQDETSDPDNDVTGISVISSSSTITSGSHRNALGLPRAASLNAFDIISFSKGFDLSRLLDPEAASAKRLVSKKPVSTIFTRLKEIVTKDVSFKFMRSKKDHHQVRMVQWEEGEEEPLTMSMDMYEMQPGGFTVLEVKKEAGVREQFEKFYEKNLKPGLQGLMIESPPPFISLK